MSNPPRREAFFVTSAADLREINSSTLGGFTSAGYRCAECGKDWASIDGLLATKCACGSVYMAERPPSETLMAVVGGGVQAVKKALRPAAPAPTPLAEDLAGTVWLSGALRAILDALPATDAALRRLMAQGPTSEQRWRQAQARVATATSTEGDYAEILGQHCPVRQQLEMLRSTLAAAVDDPEEFRRRARVYAVLQDAGLNDQHILAAMVRVTSEDEVTAPFDLGLVGDMVGRLDDALAAFPEAQQGLDQLAGQDAGRWGYARAVVHHIAEAAGDATIDRLALEVRAVAGVLDQALEGVIQDG